jgi:hypothetical protein
MVAQETVPAYLQIIPIAVYGFQQIHEAILTIQTLILNLTPP